MSHRLPKVEKPFDKDKDEKTKAKAEDRVGPALGKTAKLPELELMQLEVNSPNDEDNLETPRGESSRNVSYRRQEKKEMMVQEQIEAGNLEQVFERQE